MNNVLYCSDFVGRPSKPSCCDSCHDDADAGYHDLLTIYDESGHMTHMVCCVVHTWLTKDDTA